jgi:peptidyl-prolyl isomerase E (cyclophilin E)
MDSKPVVYVGGLAEQVEESVLHSAFIPFGEIKSIEIPLDHSTRKLNCEFSLFGLDISKGFGFVEFEEAEDCEHAIDNMNDSELMGKVIKVNYAKPIKLKEGSNKPLWAQDKYLYQASTDSKAEAQEKHFVYIKTFHYLLAGVIAEFFLSSNKFYEFKMNKLVLL